MRGLVYTAPGKVDLEHVYGPISTTGKRKSPSRSPGSVALTFPAFSGTAPFSAHRWFLATN
jgi:hypothetical protein